LIESARLGFEATKGDSFAGASVDERFLERAQASVTQRAAARLVIRHRLRLVRAGIFIDLFTKGDLSTKPEE
jgi:hypothetical protein